MIERLSPLLPLVALFAVCLVCEAAQPALPTFPMSEIHTGDLSAGWSEAQSGGAVSYRVAAKGGRRSVAVPAWWAEGSLRPPAGTVYVLEIHYKDTAPAPVIVTVASALGRYLGPTEAHRIGGSGDGKWKTAAVPVAADQLIRLPEDRPKTGFGFSADADLPVAWIKVRLAAAGDERRYNAETRAWVAAVQATPGAKVSRQIEPRKFLPGEKLPPVVAFPWAPMAPLRQHVQPTDEQVGAPIKIRMCLNEIEGGSFGVYAGQADLTRVNYTVSPLKGESGTLQADVIRRTAEYALAPLHGRTPEDLRWFPQRLWPAYDVDIPGGYTHWFLFNVRTRRGRTHPGVYKGEVTVTSAQGTASLPVEVEVLPVGLLTMDEAGLYMGSCLKEQPPAHDYDFAVDYNQNGTQVWVAGFQPPMEMVDGKLVIDFTYADEWLGEIRKRGVKRMVWFLGGDPYGFPHTMTIFRDLAKIDTRNGNKPLAVVDWVAKQSLPANRDRPLPADRELFKEWVRLVDEHARQAGWPELILSPFDEPAKWVQGPYRKGTYDTDHGPFIGAGSWIKPYFIDACKAVKEVNPNIPIYASIHHNRDQRLQEGICFLPYVDVFCTNAIHEDPKMGEKVRAAGKEFWQYSGIGVAGAKPDRARFTFGFFFGAFDSRGSLAWAYNWGKGFDLASGSNWMYAWHTPFDTIPAPYFEGMREAWDDRRIVETYRKTFARNPEALAVLEGIFKEAKDSRDRGGRDTVYDFWAAVDDAAKLDRWRNALLDRLAKRGQP